MLDITLYQGAISLLVGSLFAGSLSSCDRQPNGKDLPAAFRNCDHTTPENRGSTIRHHKGKNASVKKTKTRCQEVYFGGGKDDSARATLPEDSSLIPSTHTVLRTVCSCSSRETTSFSGSASTVHACVIQIYMQTKQNKTRHIK